MMKTPAGIEFVDMFSADDAGSFVVLRISGEYSGIVWIVECVAETLDAAMAWIDAHPLPTTGYCPDVYEVHRAERA